MIFLLLDSGWYYLIEGEWVFIESDYSVGQN